MEYVLEHLLESGSYLLMFATLLAAGLGIPIPEDIVLIAGGALLHRQVTTPIATGVVLASGVLIGDTTIFLTGRILGSRVFRHPMLARLLPPSRLAFLERQFERYGGRIVFVARHVVGLRAPTFLLAGVHRMSLARFLVWDGLALCISGPFFVAMGYFFSDQLDVALSNVEAAKRVILIAVAAVALGLVVHFALRRWMMRNGAAAVPAPADPPPQSPVEPEKPARDEVA
jgi:membrane protein DedA with SNARE-associated domain